MKTLKNSVVNDFKTTTKKQSLESITHAVQNVVRSRAICQSFSYIRQVVLSTFVITILNTCSNIYSIYPEDRCVIQRAREMLVEMAGIKFLLNFCMYFS